MPPACLYIVRHSERFDKKHPETIATSSRPQDPVITDSGKRMAYELGTYLAQQVSCPLGDIVVLTSPLVRAVQTAHGIIDGLHAALQTDGDKASVPCFVEHNLLEGCQWIMYDVNKCRALTTERADMPLPQPLYYDAAYLREHVSSHVRVDKPYDLGVAPALVVSDDKRSVAEDDMDVRCVRAARALLSCPFFDNKTVIAVGHGYSVFAWANALLDAPIASDPLACDIRYTSFICLRPRRTTQSQSSRGSDADKKSADDDADTTTTASSSLCHCASPCFATPHLSYLPSEH